MILIYFGLLYLIVGIIIGYRIGYNSSKPEEVYVVVKGVYYEGMSIMGVFLDKDRAVSELMALVEEGNVEVDRLNDGDEDADLEYFGRDDIFHYSNGIEYIKLETYLLVR